MVASHNRGHAAAVLCVEGLISQFKGVRSLTQKELCAYEKDFTQGWELPDLCRASDYKLRLLLYPEFPYAPPRVAVWPAPPVLSWPHLEKHGLLCLLSESGSYSIEDIGSVVITLLKDAVELVHESLSGINAQHFEDEFQNYWGYWEKTIDKISTICRPKGPSRWVSCYHDKNIYLVGENEDALLKWIKNRYGGKNLSKIQVVQIPLLWLPRPLQPKEFPGNVGALLSMLRKLKVDQVFIAQMIQDEDLRQKNVLIGFDGNYGVGFAGLHINNPPKSINNGFRGVPPEVVLLTRYKTVSIFGAVVSRLDGPWVHGRDHNLQESVLAKKSVVIFGIGSVGSVVVELLAKSGVGKLTLVDPETVVSENICRHALGVPSIGKSKALDLAQVIASRYPHLEVEGAHKSCEAFVRETPERLLSADLVISTIGNWRIESRLNAISRDFEGFPPVLYGWTEAHAAAGHAVVFYRGQGCLRCITDDIGRMKVPVTTWPEQGTLLPIPACAGHFQPYGAVELSYINGVVADLALDILIGKVATSIHRVWIGQQKLFEYAAAGCWNSEWVERYGDPGLGGHLVEVELIYNPSCPECGGEK